MNEWMLRILGMVFTVMTPELREGLKQFVLNLEKQAKATPNPWDDIFVGILKTVLLIKGTE